MRRQRSRLEELLRKGPAPGGLAPAALLEQAAQVLLALARQRPLLLVLDDLQWADSGSINLLFHLGRKLGGHRILVLGAYRPEEVALGREGGAPPPGAGAGRAAPPVGREHRGPGPGRGAQAGGCAGR